MGMDGTIRWKTKRKPDFNKGSMVVADASSWRPTAPSPCT
jgi:hypothetical protein